MVMMSDNAFGVLVKCSITTTDVTSDTYRNYLMHGGFVGIAHYPAHDGHDLSVPFETVYELYLSLATTATDLAD